MSDTAEALKVWDALKPMIDKEIERQTRSCVRAKKMTVTRRANGETIGVAEPYGEEVEIPYNSGLAGSRIGMPLWVYWYFNNASTMVAFTNGSGSGGTFDLDALQAEITNLRGDVALISLSADSIMTQISDIEGNISTLQQTAISLESKIENSGGDYSDIRQEIDQITLQVTDLQDADSGLSSRISSVQQTADGLSIRVGTLEDDGVSTLTNTAVTIDNSGVDIKTGGAFTVQSNTFYIANDGTVGMGSFYVSPYANKIINDSTGSIMIKGGETPLSPQNGARFTIYELEQNATTGEYEVSSKVAFNATSERTWINRLYVDEIYGYNAATDSYTKIYPTA